MTSAPSGEDRAVLSKGAARSLVAGVVIVADVALIALSLSVWSAWPEKHALIAANAVVLLVGIGCLVGVILLGRQWRSPVGATRPNRNTAVQVLNVVSTLQFVGGLALLLLLGGAADAQGFSIFGPTIVATAAVLALDVSVSRHVARTAAGVPR